jgi:hypothetical protein
MKFIWLGILLILVGFGVFWKRGPQPVSVLPPVSELHETDSEIPTPVGAPSGSPPPSEPIPVVQEHSVEFSTRLEKIAERARFALPTQETRDALIQDLSDPDLQSALGRTLIAHDRLPYDASQEKLRMNAISVLGLILKYKDVSHRDDIRRWVKQRILAVDFHGMSDIKVKQSVYGDITELLLILKHHDPESFEEVSQRIAETQNKILKTALAASR